MQMMPKEAARIPVNDSVMPRKAESSYEAVVLFSTSGRCMCTVAKTLLFCLSAGPMVVKPNELDGGGRDICAVLHWFAPNGTRDWQRWPVVKHPRATPQ